ncbi:FMN-binding protein [Rosettibacter firmus]|uniref:FMN-binding protein n=1 Tax=Rosettibacter firmus TaxID=3111522 RepID=UPI00336C00BD
MLKRFLKTQIKIILFVFLFLKCSTVEKDSLEEIKNYNLSDRFFKASVKNMHFLIETRSPEELNLLFEQWIKANNIPVDASGCKDGIYTGESPYDAYDYKHVVKIEIKNEKIIKIDYDEIKKGGKGKENDIEYNEEMKVTGTSPSIAYPSYENQMLEKQNIMKVDAVSGATYSLYRFRYALSIALMKAKLENR